MSAPAHTPPSLKLSLALHGVRVEPDASAALGMPTLGTLDLRLPGELRVAVTPVDRAPFVLARTALDGYELRPAGNGDGTSMPVTVIPPPAFYGRRTARGIPMWRIGAVHGGRLVISPSGSCGYGVRGTPCPFCIEGARPSDDDPAIQADIIEVVRAAFDEGIARVVTFNAAFGGGEDGGIDFLLPYVEAVRRHFDTLVTAQVHPPRSDRWIDRAYALGIDALSLNLELFDPHMLTRCCVGRARYIGRDRYLEALGYAATIFPRGAVSSDLVVGIEPAESTAAGIERLAALGVVPLLTGARGAPLGGDEGAIRELLAHLHHAAITHRLPPTWVAGIGVGFSPDDARPYAAGGTRRSPFGATVAHSRAGAFATRYLARVRRRLRVRATGHEAESH